MFYIITIQLIDVFVSVWKSCQQQQFLVDTQEYLQWDEVWNELVDFAHQKKVC